MSLLKSPKFKRHALSVLIVSALVLAVSGVAWAGGGGDGDHHGFPWAHFAASWVNFAVFAAILWRFALPAIKKAFAERRALLTKNLEEAKRLREEAEARLQDYQAKLDSLEEEREALLEEYNQAGEREKQRIIEDAKLQVEKMRGDAERLIEQEVKKAVASLEQKAVDEAIRIAGQVSRERLDSSVKHGKLVDRYVGDLQKMDKLGA